MTEPEPEVVITRIAPRTSGVRLTGQTAPFVARSSSSVVEKTPSRLQPDSPKPMFRSRRSAPTIEQEEEDSDRPITPPPSLNRRQTTFSKPVSSIVARKVIPVVPSGEEVQVSILSKGVVVPSTEEKSVRVKEVITPSSSEGVRVKISGKGVKLNELDLNLARMGFTVLFAFPVTEATTENTRLILGMTPLGTIVGIKLDMEGGITTVAERRINISPSNGNESVSGSYLTNVSRNTDMGSLVICRNGVCVLARGDLGEIKAEHYEIKTNAGKEIIVTADVPTSYPLIPMSEIMAYYNYSTGEVNATNYLSFLQSLQQQSDRINAQEIADQVTTLEQNIEFMQNLLINLRNVQSRAISFTQANRAEFRYTSTMALDMLKRRLTSVTLSQEDTDAWTQCQARLTSLNYNNITVINGLRSFNAFRATLDAMDRDASTFYFTLYNRVIRSIESPANLEIRRPEGWTLGRILPRAAKALLQQGRTLSVEEFGRLVKEDVASFNPHVSDADTSLLLQTFQSCFH